MKGLLFQYTEFVRPAARCDRNLFRSLVKDRATMHVVAYTYFSAIPRLHTLLPILLFRRANIFLLNKIRMTRFFFPVPGAREVMTLMTIAVWRYLPWTSLSKNVGWRCSKRCQHASSVWQAKPLVPPHLLSCVLYSGIVPVLCFVLFFLIPPLFGNRPTQHQPCPVGLVAV